MSSSKNKGQSSHSRARSKICVVCLKRSTLEITPKLISAIQEVSTIFDEISPDDIRVPTG